MVLFYQILFPSARSSGRCSCLQTEDRSIRIQSASEDELTGITQVFNKMADDIDVQILNTGTTECTYYRFVPPSIIGLLGKNNLAALTLGSNVKGKFCSTECRMYPEESLPLDQTEALMNSVLQYA